MLGRNNDSTDRDSNALSRDRSITREFDRVHSVITYALLTSTERSEHYARAGYPDKTTRKGFVRYVRCLSALLSAHHATEDDLVFPYFWEKMPDLPVEQLIAQHQQMDPGLDDIQEALTEIAGTHPASESLDRLHGALSEMWALWRAHIELEERYLTSARIRAVIDGPEQARIGKAFVAHSRRLQRRAVPLSLLIPFVLFNLSCEERSGMALRLAGIVTKLLIPYVWKRKWTPMATFLREPPPS
jgi:iron-sulfur cluster repair protein YtfE (RIC family)